MQTNIKSEIKKHNVDPVMRENIFPHKLLTFQLISMLLFSQV